MAIARSPRMEVIRTRKRVVYASTERERGPDGERPTIPVAPIARLEVVRGPVALDFLIVSESAVIGRDCTADVVVADPAVSRAHARIYRTSDGTFGIEDLRSANGTFLRGRRVARAPLSSGDNIELGAMVSLRFVIEERRSSP